MTTTLPGPTVGVVGGGQLGRMLGEAASRLGVELVVLDPTPDCPASRVAEQIVGDFDDPDAVGELAAAADVLTYEIELADPDALEGASRQAGVPVHPSPGTLRTIQDKLVQKRAIAAAGVPVPEFVAVDDPATARDAIADLGGAMLKARRGGYDGRGNAPAETPDRAPEALSAVGGDALAERFVDFERELAVIGVRGSDEVATYPVTETIHEAEILRETVVPSRADPAVRDRAREVARDVLGALDGRGVFGIELFETRDGEVLLNEVAPRPHNSGHWTIEGARTSQFEQHLRAVLGWPLGPTEAVDTAVTANVLGDVDDPTPATLHGVDDVLAAPATSLHWYGKREVRPLRKMGHLTAVADESPADLLARARDLRDGLTFTKPNS